MNFYYDNDADLALLTDIPVAVIGYGNQGRAQALNLHDSGIDVTVGLRESSPRREAALAEGLKVDTIERAAEKARFIVLLIPDEEMPVVYERSIAPHMKPGKILGFAHGFAILYGGIQPPGGVDVVLNSPKCIGYLVRENFVNGYGFPNLFAVHRDASGHARDYALAYAKAIGGTRAGVMESTFEEETVTNLFGEQSVLCGGIASLIKTGFDTLVEAGYSPEVAYFECLHEIKPIFDLFYANGLAEMNRRISNTAEFGEYVSGPRVFDEHVRENMRAVLRDIQSGEFARRWTADHAAGGPEFTKLRGEAARHPIEDVGARLRTNMPWLKK